MTELHDMGTKVWRKKKQTDNLRNVISTVLHFDIRRTYLHGLHRTVLEDLYLASVLVQNSDVATLHLNLRISGALVEIYRSVSINHIYTGEDRWYGIAEVGERANFLNGQPSSLLRGRSKIQPRNWRYSLEDCYLNKEDPRSGLKEVRDVALP